MAVFKRHNEHLTEEIERLAKVENLFCLLVYKLGVATITMHEVVWEGIVRNIMAQQLSNHVMVKLLDRVPTEAIRTPQALLDAIADDEQRVKEAVKKATSDKEAAVLSNQVKRDLPFSNSKLEAMKTIAHMYLDGTLSDELLKSMSSQERRKVLGEIKGIGHWTLDMLDIFVFGDKDVFPTTDLGVIKAVMSFSGFPKEMQTPLFKKRYMEHFAEKVKGYGTCATIYLWLFSSLSEEKREYLVDCYQHDDPNDWKIGEDTEWEEDFEDSIDEFPNENRSKNSQCPEDDDDDE